MTQARESEAKAAWWRLGKFGLVLCIVFLIISATYWFEIITGDADWRTWVAAVSFLIWPILMLATDRQGRRAAQLSKQESGQFIDFTVPTSLPEGEARKRLIEDGWEEDAEGSHLVRGSRLWTRLWGAYLVSITKWPMIAEVLTAESGTAVRVRDNFGRMWSWSVPDQDGQVAGGAAGRMASGVDAAISGARQIEEHLTRLLSE